MRRITRPVLCVSAILPLVSGCGLFQSASDKVEDAKLAVGDVGHVNRCFEFMRKAMPDAEFKMTDQSVSTAITSDSVSVLANRTDVKPPAAVAVQCRFDHGIIVDFHWLKGPLS